MKAESGDAAAQPGEPPSSDPEGGSSGGVGTVPTLPFDRRAAELQRPAAGKEPALAPDPFHPPQQPPPALSSGGAVRRDPSATSSSPVGSAAEDWLSPPMLLSDAPRRAGGVGGEASSSAAHAGPEGGQSGISSPCLAAMDTAPAPVQSLSRDWTVPNDEYVSYYRSFLDAYRNQDASALVLTQMPTPDDEGSNLIILGLPGESSGLAMMLQKMFSDEENVSNVLLLFTGARSERKHARDSYLNEALCGASDDERRRASGLAEAVLPLEGDDLGVLYELLTALRGFPPAHCRALCARSRVRSPSRAPAPPTCSSLPDRDHCKEWGDRHLHLLLLLELVVIAERRGVLPPRVLLPLVCAQCGCAWAATVEWAQFVPCRHRRVRSLFACAYPAVSDPAVSDRPASPTPPQCHLPALCRPMRLLPDVLAAPKPRGALALATRSGSRSGSSTSDRRHVTRLRRGVRSRLASGVRSRLASGAGGKRFFLWGA